MGLSGLAGTIARKLFHPSRLKSQIQILPGGWPLYAKLPRAYRVRQAPCPARRRRRTTVWPFSGSEADSSRAEPTPRVVLAAVQRT